MIELQREDLVIRFPELDDNVALRISFQRTLRIPDDGRAYPLPAGLGRLPVEHVDDHVSRLPPKWKKHGGVLLPMYQSEATWIHFDNSSTAPGDPPYPFAVKIAAGKINAVTGDSWCNSLKKNPQDYLVIPPQPWIDGYYVDKDTVRQFVAMPLGDGYTAEEQLTGNAEFGGIQIIVYPMKLSRYRKIQRKAHAERKRENRRGRKHRFLLARRFDSGSISFCMAAKYKEMGLAPGGFVHQQILQDIYGFNAWDLDQSSRCYVHILNSIAWQSATGRPAPGRPLTATDYQKANLPWFEYYDEKVGSLCGSGKLSSLEGIATTDAKRKGEVSFENDTIHPDYPTKLKPSHDKFD